MPRRAHNKDPGSQYNYSSRADHSSRGGLDSTGFSFHPDKIPRKKSKTQDDLNAYEYCVNLAAIWIGFQILVSRII
jgi:hypothetical protein